MILNLSASLKTDTSQSLSLAHPLFPHHLLILVDWSGIRYACVQRSTCTSCRIPSHANPTLRFVKEEIDLPRHGLLAWSTQQRLSTVDLVSLYAPWSHAGGALANLMCTIYTIDAKLVAMAMFLEGSKKVLQIIHLHYILKFYHPCKFGEDRSGGC